MKETKSTQGAAAPVTITPVQTDAVSGINPMGQRPLDAHHRDVVFHKHDPNYKIRFRELFITPPVISVTAASSVTASFAWNATTTISVPAARAPVRTMNMS